MSKQHTPREWLWDVMPCELRLNDDKGTVLFRCDPNYEPDERVKTIIAATPKTAAERYELLLMVESLIEVIVEDWGWRERLRRLNRAKALLLSVTTSADEEKLDAILTSLDGGETEKP